MLFNEILSLGTEEYIHKEVIGRLKPIIHEIILLAEREPDRLKLLRTLHDLENKLWALDVNIAWIHRWWLLRAKDLSIAYVNTAILTSNS